MNNFTILMELFLVSVLYIYTSIIGILDSQYYQRKNIRAQGIL